jgi:Helix-turn-helix of DDE superfamily endonuclease
MNVLALRQNPAQFLAMTSLHPQEFDDLLDAFTTEWERFYRYHTLDGKLRNKPCFAEHGNALLKGTDAKLLFLLTYLKTNPLQQQQGLTFGISQPRVSQVKDTLLRVLNQTLGRRGLLPVRNGEELAQRLADHPYKVFAYDGLERSIPRNQDQQAQKEEYSGKKKRIA